jgi:hypothetical protein
MLRTGEMHSMHVGVCAMLQRVLLANAGKIPGADSVSPPTSPSTRADKEEAAPSEIIQAVLCECAASKLLVSATCACELTAQ